MLVRPAGTLLESDSGEAAERLISTKLDESATPKVVSNLTSSMLGFLFFARVPAMIRVRRSPIVTALGKPIYDFRPDSISTWLVFSNAQYAGPDILRGLADRLFTTQDKLTGSSVGEDVYTDNLGAQG